MKFLASDSEGKTFVARSIIPAPNTKVGFAARHQVFGHGLQRAPLFCFEQLLEGRLCRAENRLEIVVPLFVALPGLLAQLMDDNALIQPQSRHAYARLIGQAWTDALRKLQPEGPLWTFWDYERNRWPLDKGMRLDQFLLSPTVRDRLVHGGVDRWVRGEENASDHAPAWIVLDR
jgi:hypothetical protein